MAQPTGSTFVGEVATHFKDRISLPSHSIRRLGWAPGDRLLVQRLNEDMVLVMRRPKKSTGQISEETYEEPTDAGDAAESLHGGSGVALDSPEAAMSSTQAEEQLTDTQPTMGDTASATALLERLEQRIAALEQLLSNEPTGAESASPPEEPETLKVDQEMGPEAASPVVEPPSDGMAQDEATSAEALGSEESEIEDEPEQPGEELNAEAPSSTEVIAEETTADEVEAEEPEPIEAQASGSRADEAGARETGVEMAQSEEFAQTGAEQPPVAGAAPEGSGKQDDDSSAGPEAVGAGVGAAAGVAAGVGAGSATGDAAGVDAGSATGVGAGLQAGVALRIIGDLLRQVVPEEAVGQAMGHLEVGRREGLLALRTLLSAGIERIDAMQEAGSAAKGATDEADKA